MTTETYKGLSLYNERGVLIIPAKQNDTGRKFRFEIYNSGEDIDLTGCTVSFRENKADGTAVQSETCCYIDGVNEVVIDTALGNGNQILTAPGINDCELHFSSNGTNNNMIELTTWTFQIMVKSRVSDGSNLTSQSNWDKLDELLNMYYDATGVIYRLDNAEQNIEELERCMDAFIIRSDTQPSSTAQDSEDYWHQKYENSTHTKPYEIFSDTEPDSDAQRNGQFWYQIIE